MIHQFWSGLIVVALAVAPAWADDSGIDAIEAGSPAAAGTVFKLYVEPRREDNDLASVNGTIPRFVQVDGVRVGVDIQTGADLYYGGYLEARRTEGSIGSGPFALDIDASGVGAAIYGAYQITDGIFVGSSFLFVHDDGSFDNAFASIDAELEVYNLKPFIVGVIPIESTTLLIKAAADLSRSRVDVEGASTAYVNFAEIEVGLEVWFPIYGPVSGELGGDLAIITREDVFLGGARAQPLAANFSGALNFDIDENVRLRAEVFHRAFDEAFEESDFVLRVEFKL